MSLKLCSAVLLSLLATSAHALDRNIVRQLQALDPEERLEQRCDIEAMKRIREEQDGFRPDKVIAYTFSDPVIVENSMEAPGAAVRSRGEWYRLEFRCETGPKKLTIREFDYSLGAMVPREDWQRHYLYE